MDIQISNMFSRQAIPMVWDFVERNVFSGSTGSVFGSNEAKPAVNNAKENSETRPGVTEKLDSAKTKEAIPVVTPDPAPKIASALKELPRGYIEVGVSGALEEIYYLVPYNGKVRNYTVKKTDAMSIPQVKAGKEVMVPVSVVEEDRIISIAKDLYKTYEKNMKSGAEL